MKIHIHHRTNYHYAEKVSFGSHQLMMRPREGHGIRLEKCSFSVSVPHWIRWIRDLHENNIGIVDFAAPAAELVIDGDFILDVCEENPFNFVIVPEAAEYPFTYERELLSDLLPLSRNIYVRDADRIRDWLTPLWHPGKRLGTLELLQELNTTIYRTLHNRRRIEKGVQSPAETLEKNSGSCRDFATLFMEACRLLGLAARFVSGYMYSSEITGLMSMHGWAEIYLPGAGWIGFDPSWGILADSNYIPAVVSRDSEHAPPISGTYFGTPRAFSNWHVDLYVKRIDDVLPANSPLTKDQPDCQVQKQTQLHA
ncbi:MAG: transglutaminase family protein [Methylacidiphilales bacterium]|nr:transglutaminase family protein [Candidatus Methylacidiphilales bacterium]